MGFIETLIHLPTAEQWPLIKPLILLMQVFFLPFMGLLLVSALLSVGLRLAGRSEGLVRDMVDVGLRHPAAWIVFGVVPLLSMLFLFGQYLYEQPIAITDYLLRLLGLIVAGMALLLIYRKTLKTPLGGIGALLLMGGMYHFIATISLVAVPERWELVELPLPFFHSLQPIVHFKIFLAVSLLVTGSGTLVAFFHWSEREILTADSDLPLVRRIAYALLIFGILPLPALVVADFATTPFFTLAPGSFVTPSLMLVVILITGFLAFGMVMKQHTRYAWATFVCALVLMTLFSSRQQSLMTVGNMEHELATQRRVDEIRTALVAERLELYASASELPADAGEQLFNRVCSACHTFDTRIVGPPYNDVLSKYVGDLEGLAGFVFSPSRVNSDYPAMPNQALRRAEARAVAAYLLTEFTGEPVGSDMDEPEEGAHQ